MDEAPVPAVMLSPTQATWVGIRDCAAADPAPAVTASNPASAALTICGMCVTCDFKGSLGRKFVRPAARDPASLQNFEDRAMKLILSFVSRSRDDSVRTNDQRRS